MKKRKIELAIIAFGILVTAAAFIADTPQNIFSGLLKIILSQSMLITDYSVVGGIGAALVNAALVMIIGVLVLMLSDNRIKGPVFAAAGLLFGFALFGKNIANILPLIFGTWLYAKYKRVHFSRYAIVAVMATSLAPLVSFICLYKITAVNIVSGILTGVLAGFVLPALSEYTFRVQSGMNLYNMGFACGMLAIIAVPVLRHFGMKDKSEDLWLSECGPEFIIGLAVLVAAVILIGTFACEKKGRAAWRGYFALLKTSGRAPSDYVRQFGLGPVLINMGMNGIAGAAYILVTGGDFNGPVIGAIVTVMGFSAYGKHTLNILPIMAGVALGNLIMTGCTNDPVMQLAGLFGTALAPIAGHFGWPYGIIAGILHSAVIFFSGTPALGLNLYNNGFCAGLLAIVLYPIFTALPNGKNRFVKNDAPERGLIADEVTVDVQKRAKKRRDG